MVDSMSVMELTLASLPLNIKEMQASSQMQDSFHGASEDQNPDEEDEENQVNWKKVADSVGTHSSEDCRTRWLMHDRPGLNSDEWSHEEQDRLKEIVGGLWEVKNGEDGEDRDQSKGKGKSKAKGKAIVKGMRKGKGKEREVEVDMEVETENGEGKEKEENELEIGDEIDWEEIARLLNVSAKGFNFPLVIGLQSIFFQKMAFLIAYLFPPNLRLEEMELNVWQLSLEVRYLSLRVFLSLRKKIRSC